MFFLLINGYLLKLRHISGIVSAIHKLVLPRLETRDKNVADKRDIRRIKKRISIRFGVNGADRVAFTEDFSMTGMFIKTPNIATPNSKIIIEFDLPDSSRVEIEARVMWAKKVPQNLFHLVKKSGMGVRFLRFNAGEDAFDDYFERVATPL